MARRKNSSVLKKGLNSVENQMTWQQMFIDFSSYKLEMNRKRMTKTAHALKELQDHNQSIDQQTLNNYKQARQNYLEQKKHVAKLKKQCESLEKQKNEASWQDFAKYAHLSNQTDALELLIQALIELDSKNLETQQFLKKYFKIDSKKMQDMPLETASAYIKQKLFQFFDLNDSNFVHLLREQKLAI
jgi:hypothetical protein